MLSIIIADRKLINVKQVKKTNQLWVYFVTGTGFDDENWFEYLQKTILVRYKLLP